MTDHPLLAGLPMAGVRPAPLAVLAQRDAIGVVALALVRLVVAPLALLAGEGDSDAHVSAGHAPLRDEMWSTDGLGTEKRPAPGESESSVARITTRRCPRRGRARWWGDGVRVASASVPRERRVEGGPLGVCMCRGPERRGCKTLLPPWRKVTAGWLQKPVDVGLKTRATLVSHARAHTRATEHAPRGGRRPVVGEALRRGAVGADEPVALGPERRLGAIGHADRAEDVRQVRLDGLLADAQAHRDELVRHPAADERKPGALALREPRVGTVRRAGGEQLARRAGVERRVALGRGADAAEELLGLGVLQEIAERARVERAEDALAVRERREHDDAGVGVRVDDALRGLDAVHDRHRQVHEDDVRPGVAGERDRLRAVRGRPDDLDVAGAVEQLGEPGPHDGVVLGEQHTDHATGTSRLTRVPRPGSESMSSLPPASRAMSASTRRPRRPSSRAACPPSGVKPRPSSAIVRPAWLFSRITLTSTLRARLWVITLRRASCAVRNMSASASGSSRRAGGISTRARRPRDSSGATRSDSPAASPARCRSGG